MATYPNDGLHTQEFNMQAHSSALFDVLEKMQEVQVKMMERLEDTETAVNRIMASLDNQAPASQMQEHQEIQEQSVEDKMGNRAQELDQDSLSDDNQIEQGQKFEEDEEQVSVGDEDDDSKKTEIDDELEGINDSLETEKSSLAENKDGAPDEDNSRKEEEESFGDNEEEGVKKEKIKKALQLGSLSSLFKRNLAKVKKDAETIPSELKEYL